MHKLSAALLCTLLLSGCAQQTLVQPTVALKPVPTKAPEPEQEQEPSYQTNGMASYYANRHHGQRTASGERMDNNALTAAHRELPFGSRVKVTNLNNQRSVIVRINDRGPFSKGRVIDLSQAAAREIDMLRAGIVKVQVESLD